MAAPNGQPRQTAQSISFAVSDAGIHFYLLGSKQVQNFALSDRALLLEGRPVTAYR